MKDSGKHRMAISARTLVIALVILAITISGSSYITVISTEYNNPDRAKNSGANICLLISLNLAEGQNSVSDNLPGGTGKSLYLTMPAVISAYNMNEIRPITKIIELKPDRNIDLRHFLALTTTASISSEKAMEFTLVGAKPSGTS